MKLAQINYELGIKIVKFIYRATEFLHPRARQKGVSRWESTENSANYFIERYYNERWMNDDSFSIPHSMKMLSMDAVYRSVFLFFAHFANNITWQFRSAGF